MKKLCIDVDGVLANFAISFIDVLRRLGLKISKEAEPLNWSWDNLGVTNSIMKEAWNIIDSTENWWETIPPFEDIKIMEDYFKANVEKNCEIYFMTARRQSLGFTSRLQTEHWLYKYLNCPIQTINVIPVPHAMNKVAIIDAMSLDFSIDDHTPSIVNATSIKDHHKAFLLNRPWNTDGKYYGIKSVNSLKEFFNEVDKYENLL